MAQSDRACWCGNQDLSEFSDLYRRCARCQTLVTRITPAQDDPHIHNDDQDFYGKEYWFKHQVQDLGFLNINDRARSDLSERCAHWMRTLLKYKLPPGKALELGCAHGGFVAMLKRAGFDASGLELSPWVVDFAKKTFDIPMLLGPLEDQSIAPASLDVIALMDVLEHLPDPAGTMGKALELLKDDGILLIQTPCYQEGRTHEQMVRENDLFLEQFKANEHLNLFSQTSARELFDRLGARHIAFEPPMFGYDMFILVSRRPLKLHETAQIEHALSATPDGRMIQALLDGDNRLRTLRDQHNQTEADRAKRLEVIGQLNQQVQQIDADRSQRLSAMQTLQQQLQQLQEQSRQEIASAVAQRELTATEAAKRLKIIEQQAGQIAQIEMDRANRLSIIETLSAEVQQFQEAARQRLQVIEQQQQEMTQLRQETTQLRQETSQLRQELQSLTASHQKLLNRPAVRALRRMGLA
ncbi:MAG: methyltransferase domain-containing protein [Phycisphaerales bacterium]|nr:methyltransferase domain-containing protein [Phycisphaerales bacterium]